jgi:hypothetical protein
MTDEKLKSFKISDQVKPTDRSKVASGSGKKSQEEPAPSAGSAGFPLIEGLVESAAPDLTGLDARTAQLDEMAKGPGTPKDKAAAKKAHGAYVKARALIDYLLETKNKMGGAGGGGASGG